MHFILVAIYAALLGAVAAAPKTSNDGSCGPQKSCLGSKDGQCCSRYGYCGSTSAYCGTGCQPLFGDCTAPSSKLPSLYSTTRPTASPPASSASFSPKRVSPNGACGPKNSYTCLGSREGNCCSQYNYCGSTSAYCGVGCQSSFGTCGSVSSSLKSSKSHSSTSQAKSSSSSSSSTSRVSTTSSASSTTSTIASSSASSTSSSSPSPTEIVGSIADGCAAGTATGSCYNGYMIACGSYYGGNVDSQINVADAEACANACTTDSVCQEAILFTPSTCDLVVVGNNVFIQAVDSISFLPNATCPQA